MRIHREGFPTITLVGVLVLLLARWRPISLVMSVPAWLFFIQFFRNPPRHTPDCPDGVIAPADGTVVAIERVHETEFFHDERLKISIYMSPLNVHLNRVPVTGRVIYTKYHAGKYLVAFHPKASELNERNTVVMEDHAGRQVLSRQIAGAVARRIVCYLEPEQVKTAGDELGFIKFGSRCDVFLPLDAHVNVGLQQKVTGGETVLATFAQ